LKKILKSRALSYKRTRSAPYAHRSTAQRSTSRGARPALEPLLFDGNLSPGRATVSVANNDVQATLALWDDCSSTATSAAAPSATPSKNTALYEEPRFDAFPAAVPSPHSGPPPVTKTPSRRKKRPPNPKNPSRRNPSAHSAHI
jgi:hypothetical protein